MTIDQTQAKLLTPAGLKIWISSPLPASGIQARTQQTWKAACKLSRNTSAMAGLVFLVFLLLIAVFAQHVAPFDPLEQNLSARLAPPSSTYWLGADELGRDILSRIIFGARITLYITALTLVIVAPLGLIVGTVSGYFGGVVDIVLMRIVDIFLAFPGLVLALAFSAALGPGIGNAVIAISLAAWPPIARLARAETLTVRSSDYVAAARLQAVPAWRIIFGHIMPMCIPSVIVRVTLNMAHVILAAAGLGFLGLGAQPPSPEWGSMLSTGREFMMTNWWIAAVPGVAILLTSLAFNLFGDGLRDILDPRNV